MAKRTIFFTIFLTISIFSSENNNIAAKIMVKNSMQTFDVQGATIIDEIHNKTTVLDIKKLLQTSEGILIDEQLLCPLYKKWWNFGIFYFKGLPLLHNNEYIINVMQHYKTNVFYVCQRKTQ